MIRFSAPFTNALPSASMLLPLKLSSVAFTPTFCIASTYFEAATFESSEVPFIISALLLAMLDAYFATSLRISCLLGLSIMLFGLLFSTFSSVTNGRSIGMPRLSELR